MDQARIIHKIVKADSWFEIFSKHNYAAEYKYMIKKIHPDICYHKEASKAVCKMQDLLCEVKNLSKIEDDAGVIYTLSENKYSINSDSDLLGKSYRLYKTLTSKKDSASMHFKKMLPESSWMEEGRMLISGPGKFMPLTGYRFAPKHVAWIISRMLEFIAWFHQMGRCHAGINPESVWIVPKTHGLIFPVFYHSCLLDTKLSSISGRYSHWYPEEVFETKTATQNIDISLVQRTALYLLGDVSGNGVKLKKSVDSRLIDFLIEPHYNSYDAFVEYRELLQKVFGRPKYYKLEI